MHEQLDRTADPKTGEAEDLVSLLRFRAATDECRRAVTFITDGESQREHVTFGELDARARAIAAELQSRGLAGERALLLYPSGIDFVAAFFGCLYAGVVAVPAYPPRKNRNVERIRGIVRDATPKVALTTQAVYHRMAPVLRELSDLATVEWHSTDDVNLGAADSWRAPDVGAKTLAFLQYTSGSTGSPKGVMLSHGNLLHNTAIITAAFEPPADCHAITWLPLYHDMGLIGGIIQPIYLGRPTTLLTPAHFLQKPFRWLKMLSDTGATISGGPNFAYELCAERISEEEKRQLDLSQWEIAFSGAEPVRAETIDRFCDAFAGCGFRRQAFYPCYGLAEATLMVSGGGRTHLPLVKEFDGETLNRGAAEATSDPRAATRMVSSGRSLLEQQIMIVDPEHHVELPEGRVGEIWVTGPSVAQGYWRQEELSESVFKAKLKDGRGPFLRTGDLGFLQDGELFVAGRSKDLIIIRGVNHYPQDMELSVEQSHADLAPTSGATFSVQIASREELVVVQEVSRKRDLELDEIFAAIRRAVVERHEVTPHAIVLIKRNSIPKTSSGKIQRHASRDAYLADSLDVIARWTQESGVELCSNRAERAAHRKAARAAAAQALHPTTSSSDATQSNGSSSNAKSTRTTVERVFTLIRSVARERAENLTLDTEIDSLGLDSLERMEIVAAIEDEFGGRLTEESVLGIETINDAVLAAEQLRSVRPTDSRPRKAEVEKGGFEQSPEYSKLMKTLELAEAAGLDNPYFTQHEGVINDRTTIGGREYVNYCSYNYIGMSGDPAVQKAAQEAITRYGTSVSASRLVSGEKPLHRELERSIARFIGAQDAIVMVGGHATNETVIGHMFGPNDLILHDSLAHNSIVQGCRLSGAHRRAFPHNDAKACEGLLQRYRRDYRRVLIVVEGVYSMDGDYAPLPEFVELRKKFGAYLMVDEAHSIGTMGATGRGMSEHFGIPAGEVDLWMGTLSKSLGSCGGYIAASREIIRYLKYTAPGFVYSVGLSPPNAAAALESLNQLKANPSRVKKLAANSELFLRLAQSEGLHTGTSHGTPIIPLITGDSIRALRMSQALFERGINVQPIVHPAVEESAARLRFFITSSHTDRQIRGTVRQLARAWRDQNPAPSPHFAPSSEVEGSAAVL